MTSMDLCKTDTQEKLNSMQPDILPEYLSQNKSWSWLGRHSSMSLHLWRTGNGIRISVETGLNDYNYALEGTPREVWNGQ